VLHRVAWAVDLGASRVDFVLPLLGVGTLATRFERFAGTLSASDEGVLRAFDLTLDAASLDAGVPFREAWSRVAQLFGSESYPAIQLRSTWSRPISHDRHQIDALITMHGETHYAEFTAGPVEVEIDSTGRRLHVARAEGTVDRRQWRAAGHPILEAGGLLLGHQVHVRLTLGAVAEHAASR